MIGIQRTFIWVIQFFGERSEIVGLTGRRPIDAEAGPLWDWFFAYGKIRRGCAAVLAGPSVDGFEKNSVSFEHVRIGKTFNLGEPFERGINASHER